MFDPLFFRVANTYRKISTIQAEQWNGLEDFDKIIAFIGEIETEPNSFFKVNGNGLKIWASIYDKAHDSWIGCEPGDWIAQGPEGECWAIKDRIFKATYERVE